MVESGVSGCVAGCFSEFADYFVVVAAVAGGSLDLTLPGCAELGSERCELCPCGPLVYRDLSRVSASCAIFEQKIRQFFFVLLHLKNNIRNVFECHQKLTWQHRCISSGALPTTEHSIFSPRLSSSGATGSPKPPGRRTP